MRWSWTSGGAIGELPDHDSYRARFPDDLTIVDDAFRSRSRVEVDRGANQDGYEILSELGRGGMGIVYKARQIALDRLVALKVIRSEEFASEAELVRFQNEAEAVAQLDHPHIVPVFEVGQTAGRRFFSMKLVSGSSLDKTLGEFASDARAAARLMMTVALAVHHAHQRGILHRDLKPANILVDESGEPHVSDFGLARRIEFDRDLTQTGYPMGTPSYMSPEQARGERGAFTTATDVYGLGSILYALLTGKAPFAGSSLAETLDQVRAAPPEPPRRINARVPRDLEVICLKCLEKDPSRRYSSASALAADLNRWLCGEPIEARPVGQATRFWMWCRRNPLAGGAWRASALFRSSSAWPELPGNGARPSWPGTRRIPSITCSITIFLDRPNSIPGGASLTVGELLDLHLRPHRRTVRGPAHRRSRRSAGIWDRPTMPWASTTRPSRTCAPSSNSTPDPGAARPPDPQRREPAHLPSGRRGTVRRG